MTISERVRDNRLRRMAARQRLRVVKSRRRDPRAWDYGMYWLIDRHGKTVGPEAAMDATAVEAWLRGEHPTLRRRRSR